MDGIVKVLGILFLILLAGDDEINPGPVTPGCKTRSTAAKSTEEDKNATGIEKLEAGQSAIRKTLDEILMKLDKFDKAIEDLKAELKSIGMKQQNMEKDLDSARTDICNNSSEIRDMEFTMHKHEQYSRKSSVRIICVQETREENVEDLSISCVKEQLGVEIERSEIDIVHRVGRVQEGKTRPILVKFISHKTKEQIIKKKKEAKDVRFVEDLAYGIKGCTLF